MPACLDGQSPLRCDLHLVDQAELGAAGAAQVIEELDVVGLVEVLPLLRADRLTGAPVDTLVEWM